MVDVLGALVGAILSCWSWTGLAVYVCRHFLHRPAPDPIRFWFCELKPFYLPALIAYPILLVLQGGHPTSIANLLTMTGLTINWFAFRNEDDDDDRWKRRVRKVAERIERSGARLVVVPAGGER